MLIISKKKTLLFIFSIFTSLISYAEDIKPSLNLGLSTFNAGTLGANIEFPVYKNFTAFAGTGLDGGYTVGSKIYRHNTNRSSLYLGLSYGVVSVTMTEDDNSQWIEDNKYGYTAIIGRRLLRPSGNYLTLGGGLHYEPESKNAVNPDEIDGGNYWVAFDVTYGFTFNK